MSTILPFSGSTTLDIDPDNVLRCAIGNYPNGVLVIGWNENEDLTFQSSLGGFPDILWLLENAKRDLLHMADEGQ